MAGKTFTAQLDAAILEIEGGMEYVARQSISDVMVGAQETQDGITIGAESFVEGRIPVGETKELVNSLAVNDAQGVDVGLQIQGLQLGDTMKFSWTAPHARRIEYGFTGTDSLGRTYNQPGRFFVTRNAEKFPEFVRKRAAEIKK